MEVRADGIALLNAIKAYFNGLHGMYMRIYR